MNKISKLLKFAGGLLVFISGHICAAPILIDTIDLSLTVTEADALEVNRTFNEIYVIDFNAPGDPLHVYDMDFNLKRNITFSSSYGVPEGIVRDPDSGDFFITSHDGDIRRFDSNGGFISSFTVGGAGNGLTYDPLNKTLFVSHWNTGIVEQYTLDGQLLSSFDPDLLDSLVGLSFDPVARTLLISDNYSDYVNEYDLEGNFIGTFIDFRPYPNNGLGTYYDGTTGNFYYGGQASTLLVYNDSTRPTLSSPIPAPSIIFILGLGLASMVSFSRKKTN